jgi:3-oxoacyl-[acyl-carrier-protein] synthase-1
MSTAYIVSTGIITAIGRDYAGNLASLRAGNAGIAPLSLLRTRHHLPAGEIKLSNEELAQTYNLPAHWPRTALLSSIAAKEAWEPLRGKTHGLRIGLLSANTVGGMDLTEGFYPLFKKDAALGNDDDIRHHECGAITRLTASALDLQCWSTTISTACSSSANTIMMAARLLQQGRMDVVIAGGADALSAFTLNGFNALMILDREPCRPFDQNRKGLNLGEGAAYVVLANQKALQQCEISPLAIVSGFANANDAHHQTASSPDGKGNRFAMEGALRSAGIDADAISYINLHGTGTENNDASEGAAISAVFGKAVPTASSTKAFTGHTLGAAGAVEAVFAVMSIQEQCTWAHLRLQTPIADLDWQPATALIQQPVKHVLSNSFGFGGNCSSLVLSAVDPAQT